MVSWQLSAKFPLFFVKSFKHRETLFLPSMTWVLEGLASSGVASAIDCQIVNPQAMQKCSQPTSAESPVKISACQAPLSVCFPMTTKHFSAQLRLETLIIFIVGSGKLWPCGLEGLCSYSALSQDALTVRRTRGSALMLLPMSHSHILVLRKHYLWVTFILLEGFLCCKQRFGID